MKYVAVLLLALFSATYTLAKPCRGAYFYADHSGKGAIRVTSTNGTMEKKDVEKAKKALADSNVKEWEGLAERLQAKLGSHYQVTVFNSVAEFNKSAHECP